VPAAGALAAEKPALKIAADGPPAAVSPGQLRRLVAQLGDRDHFRRQRAEQQLAQLGLAAIDVLGEAAESEDLEIAARARRLLALLRVRWADESDPAEVKQVLRDYEFQNAERRQATMALLAELPRAAGLPALCRLVRYEKSALLSKHAATLLLGSLSVPRDGPANGDFLAAAAPARDVAERLRAGLGGSRQTAATWLLTWARSAEDPSVMSGPWSRLVDAEQALWQASPSQSSSEILSALRRIQVAWLQKLGRGDELLAAMDRLVRLDQGNPETLGNLLDWLAGQKDWKALDALAEQFASQIAEEPLLLYALAEGRAARGDAARAERLAGQALALYPGGEPPGLTREMVLWLASNIIERASRLLPEKAQQELVGPRIGLLLSWCVELFPPGRPQAQDAYRHLSAAVHLQNHGRMEWAKREYQHVIAAGTPTSDGTFQAQRLLAEMLHDQGEEREAGEVLQQLVQAAGVNRPPQARILHGTLGEIRARMHYFFACHCEAHGDRARQRESLERALAEDAADVDVLIACYRLSDAPGAYRKTIRKLIAAAATDLRQKIAEEPDDPTNYNQLAWLVGNTEGDLDEALRAASKAVELAPETGGYYDTLARVYFARGDYAKAVRHQTKASQLDPHSGQVTRQLALFRKALGETKAKPQ